MLVNVLAGRGVDPAMAQQLLHENVERSREIVANIGEQPKGMDMLLSIVPSNVLAAASSNGAILSLMFFALMFGIGMVLSPDEKTAPLRKVIEGVFEVSMTLINLGSSARRRTRWPASCSTAAIFGFDLLIRPAPTWAWWCWRWRCTWW